MVALLKSLKNIYIPILWIHVLHKLYLDNDVFKYIIYFIIQVELVLNSVHIFRFPLLTNFL